MARRPYLQPGRLDTKIRIERPVTEAGSYGREVVTHWALVATCWADRRDITGREILEAGAERAENRTRFIIRDPHVTLDARMRVIEIDTGQAFGIDSIARLDQRGLGFELMCRNEDNVGAQP